jgi:hypothetical protein
MADKEEAPDPESDDPQPSTHKLRRRLWIATQVVYVLAAISQVALFIASTHIHL